MKLIRQFIYFVYQQSISCIFPIAIFITLAISKVIDPPLIHRYDFILIICVLIQIMMVVSGLESKEELKVISIFHVIGLGLELYKVHMGSWAYPEPAWAKVFGVPLYSGFMYASVASYLCQSWSRLKLRLHGWPSAVWTALIGCGIYLNFFTHHYLYDMRWILTALLIVVFYRTYVEFSVKEVTYRMPLVLSFVLIGFLIWIAENIATFLGAWQYPYQRLAWSFVDFGKISSWFLLVIISFIIVAQLKHVKESLRRGEPEGLMAGETKNGLNA
ncbi:DUF817 domain-containing protein [Paenactinomyces guangxiensis]|uniref:DUF817 domain-containing protein n=1 Tax=Paenactinomyces guangxiensis TaxID=1490290 RepID=A0A7W1WTU6_9BACL|nr:DUF817 domain-containing protein [Paenactinomyces guangxiensis]MBA4495746.1 DUF817 domain-containing protein [Paenactinomyces guangxiensis]MBH8592735.1 DUF817 domain-containing protein [Paenactinomyces guangxiensis]